MTPDMLMRCTRCSPSRALMFAPFLGPAMDAFDIDSPERRAAFLAQVAHESGSLYYLYEIWGPTPAQMLYEPPSSKATQLGNTLRGDGIRFRGHGLLQITGRTNHAASRDRLRKVYGPMTVPDFEIVPERLAEPIWAARSAAEWWSSHGCNGLADACYATPGKGWEALTRRINGGTTGIEDRLSRWNAAKAALGIAA